MEETLIQFKTAKLAKIKGFNEYCKEFYNEGRLVEPYTIKNNITIETSYYAAPTQSLLQKWLREKHDIHCQPNVAEEGGKNTYEACIVYNSQKYKDTPLDDSDNWFDTYEEALEDCLIEALKMLPDWKL